MSKVFLTLALMMASAGAWSKEPAWYLLDIEKGCITFREVYHDFPYLRGATNPDQMFKLFRKKFEDATFQPFIDVLAESHKRSKTVASAEERDAYKNLTSSNAFLISSSQSGVDILLMTKAACKDLGGVVGR